LLRTTGRIHDGRTLLYRSQKAECDLCLLKLKCCPNTPHRKIPRDINEEARDVARALYDTLAFEQSRRDRKRVEMLFAHLKRILRLGRLRLRGPCGAQDAQLRAALQEAHAERLGIWVAIWPVTLLALSFIVEKRVEG